MGPVCIGEYIYEYIYELPDADCGSYGSSVRHSADTPLNLPILK